MAKGILAILLIATAAGGGYLYWNYQVQPRYENGKLVSVTIVPRTVPQGAAAAWQSPEQTPARPPRPTIRVATFNLGPSDERKLSNRRISDVLLHVIPQFELIALQGFQGQTDGAVVRLIEQINRGAGRCYAYAACPTGRRDATDEYSAFLFDQTAIEIDRSTLHLVQDAAGRFRHPPLVAAFRVRGPAESEAFTFTLVNVHCDPERTGVELDLLRDVFKAVRDDGRNEDDIIMLGDLGADEEHLGQLGQILDLTAAITSMPTTVRGTRRVDNILFDRRATVEFTGRAEVMDLMRECDLTIEGALETSEHLPVWAEFSSYEGGQAGHVATAPGPVAW